MDKNEPFKVGDHVQLRQFPRIKGVIWDVVPRENMVLVDWSNPDDDVYVRDPHQWLEKIK